MHYYENLEQSDIFKLYNKEIDTTKLSEEETLELIRKAQAGDKIAREKLILHNMRLVLPFATKYRNRGVEIIDLIQEGNIGLMRSIDSYDETKGFKFSTYASSYIIGLIKRATYEKGEPIKIPSQLKMKVNKYEAVRYKLEELEARDISDEELATFLEVPLEEVKKILGLKRKMISYEELSRTKKQIKENLMDIDPTEEELFKEEVKEIINNVIEKLLKPKEKVVIKMKFELDGKGPYKLQDIADEIHVSKEGVRQIAHKAMHKLSQSDDMIILNESIINNNDVPKEEIIKIKKKYLK